MTTRQKTFDCVEMKRKTQESLMCEYNAREGEFATYREFISEKVRSDAWAKKVMDQLPADELTEA